MKEIVKLSSRAIRKSFARFLAVFSIIALGVGFFSGLRISEKAMLITANDYISDRSMYDLRLLSNYGFTDEELNSIKKTDNVTSVVGSYDIDALVKNDGGSDVVIHFASLSDSINKPSLVSGRMPKNDSEILVDARYYSESDIGRKIVLSDENTDSVFENFVYSNFSIVGTVTSPEYLSYNRGSTNLSSGNVYAFAYLDPQAFNSEYYTSCFIKIDNNSFIYSDEYDCAIKNIKDELLSKSQAVLYDRYTMMFSEFKSKLDSAEKEYSKWKRQYDLYSSLVTLLRKISNLPLLDSQIDTDDISSVIDFLSSHNLISSENSKMIYDLIDQIDLIAPDSGISLATLVTFAETKLADSEEDLKNAQKLINDGREKLDSMSECEVYALTRNENVGYVNFKNDTSIIKGISLVFPIFFFLVAALVCNTTMSRMVYEDRSLIGTLKALGYSKRAIRSIYIIYSGMASVCGCIVGYLLGIYFIPKIIWEVYDIMYGFTGIEFIFSSKLFIISLLVSLICSVGVAIVSVYTIINLQPSELMRPQKNKKGKKSIIEDLPYMSKISFTSRISLRNTFKYKSRFFMMVVGIAGCTALLLTGFGVRDSIYDIADEQFANIMSYDYYVSLKNSLNREDLCEMLDTLPEGTDKAIGVCEIALSIQKGDNIKSAYINCFSQNNISQFIYLKSGKKKIDIPNKGFAVISAGLSQRFGLKIGDTITGSDSSMNSYSFTVSDICDNHVYDYIFISSESLEDITGSEIAFNKLCVIADKDADKGELGVKLGKTDNVINVQNNDNIRSNVSDMLSSLNLVVLLLTFCAAALALIVIYNLTNLNIIERSREIATLKVIGFTQKETHLYIFRESLIQSLIGIIVGLPFGILLNSFVIEKINIDMVNFYAKISFISFLISFALAVCFSLLSNTLLIKKINNINITDSLKSVE